MAPTEFANSRPIIVGEREQQLDMMLHLLEFSRMIVLVTGDSGSGKSSFLQAGCHQLSVHHQASCLSSSQLLGEEDLFHEWSTQLGCESNSAAIHLALAELHQRGELFCLLIDDAHLLGLPVLVLLAEWSSQYENLKIALAGDDVLLNLAHSVMMEMNEKNLFHALHLTPLNDPDMDAFIAAFLSQAELSTTPFSSRQLNQIKQLAKGNIATLVVLIERGLGRQKSSTISSFPVGHVAAILLVAIALGASYWLKDSAEEVDPLADIIERAGSDMDVVSIDEELSMMDEQMEASQAVTIESESVTLNREIPVVSSIAASSQFNSEDVSDVKGFDGNAFVESEAQPESVVQTAELTEKAKVVTVKADAPVEEIRHPLMAADKNQYVLQLVGVRSQSSAARVTADLKRQLGTDRVSFYETRYQGKPWFVVVYGPVGNQEQARAQVDKVARSTKTKPWVRAVANIQEDMAKAD